MHEKTMAASDTNGTTFKKEGGVFIIATCLCIGCEFLRLRLLAQVVDTFLHA
jgi:hypothetical protein